jgi:hypothetical protein
MLPQIGQLKCDVTGHELTPNAPYFLLALPENFYLWKNSVSYEAPPDYIVDAAETLTSYFNPLPRSLDEISHDGLEMLMDAWIRHLVSSQLNSENAGSGLAWLFDSGLYETIKQGSVVVEI